MGYKLTWMYIWAEKVRPTEQIYNADFYSPTWWTILALGWGSINIANGTAEVVSGYWGIYRDISNDLNFSNARVIEIEYVARPRVQYNSVGLGVVLWGQHLDSSFYWAYTWTDGTYAYLQIATSWTWPWVKLAWTDVYTMMSGNDLTTQTDTPVKTIIDLSGGTYEFYLYGTLKSSGSIPPSAISDFYNVNNQYLNITMSDYSKIKDLSIKVS